MALVLENNNLVVVKCVLDDFEIGIWVTISCCLHRRTVRVLTGGYRLERVFSLVGFYLTSRVQWKRASIPVRFSMSRPEIEAPKFTPELSGTAIRSTEISLTAIVMYSFGKKRYCEVVDGLRC